MSKETLVVEINQVVLKKTEFEYRHKSLYGIFTSIGLHNYNLEEHLAENVLRANNR